MSLNDCKRALLMGGLVLLGACGMQRYQARPLQVEQGIAGYLARSLDAERVREYMQAHGRSPSHWPLSRWDRESLALAALALHPGLAVREAELRIAEAGVVRAGQVPNPGLNLQSEHHSDAPGGISHWLLGGILDLVLEYPGKREARQRRARAEVGAARLRLEAEAWRIRQGVLEAHARYLGARESEHLLRSRTELLEGIVDLLERRRRAGEVSAFEVSSSRLRLQRARLDGLRSRSATRMALQDLAAAIGVPGAQLERISLAGSDYTDLPVLDPARGAAVRGAALHRRVDIRAGLQAYAIAEARLQEALKQQYPDLVLSPGYVFDQNDNIWALAGSLVLPVLNRHRGEILEAEARREQRAAEFNALQVEVIQAIDRARESYQLALSEERSAARLLADTGARQAQIVRQYDLGYTDHLAVLRGELELVEARVSLASLHRQSVAALVRLEDALQQTLSGIVAIPPARLEP